MDLALKKRMIGAAVIIALVVIFVPMFFDEERVGKNQSISIEIPDEPEDLKHKVIQIDTASGVSDNKSDLQVSQPEVITNKPGTIVEETIVDVVDNTQPKTDVGNTLNQTEVKPEPNDLVIQINEDTQQDVTEPKIDVSQPIKPAIKKDIVQESSNDSGDQDSYKIKLGSFTQQKNAQQLKAQVINLGINAVVQKDPSSELFKVYSQSFKTMRNAQKVIETIEKSQLNIGKPTIEKFDKPTTKAFDSALDTGWIVQIGSFSNQTNSLKLRNKIRDKGFVAFIDEITNSKNQILYRLRIGPYATRDEAELAKKKIAQNMQLNGIIKPHEKQKVVE